MQLESAIFRSTKSGRRVGAERLCVPGTAGRRAAARRRHAAAARRPCSASSARSSTGRGRVCCCATAARAAARPTRAPATCASARCAVRERPEARAAQRSPAKLRERTRAVRDGPEASAGQCALLRSVQAHARCQCKSRPAQAGHGSAWSTSGAYAARRLRPRQCADAGLHRHDSAFEACQGCHSAH